MRETWATRDLPVLDTIVTLLDEPGATFLLGMSVVERCGMDSGEVESAVRALSGEYVILGRQLAAEGGIGMQQIEGVTAKARQVVGQWPTAESLIDQLVAGLGQAAEHEPDPEQRSKLRSIASGLSGAARVIAIDIAQKMLEHQIPGAH